MPLRALWSLAASTLVPGVIWTGATNGVIQVSRDHGRTWNDVSIPGIQIAPRPIRAAVEASQLDGARRTPHSTCTFARLWPYVYRTHDYGKTWTKIVTGLPAELPSGAYVRAVRADPKRRGLLFAATESGLRLARRR